MEETLELLHEQAEELSFPLDLPSEEQVIEAEEALLLPFPYDLRQFLLQASDVTLGQLEPVTVADERSHTFLPEVAATAWSQGLSRETIPICGYAGGYAFMRQDGEMGFWSIATQSESEQSSHQWESFWHWAREVWLQS